MNGNGQIKMDLDSEIRAFNEDLEKKLPKSRISVIIVAKYVNMHREWATYTNPYIANSKKNQ